MFSDVSRGFLGFFAWLFLYFLVSFIYDDILSVFPILPVQFLVSLKLRYPDQLHFYSIFHPIKMVQNPLF